MADDTWEDRRGALGRNAARLLRALRWQAKGLAGVPRTLLVETRWRLGDEIMALPIFESLRQKYPIARIEVLTNYPDLFDNHPFVDVVNPAAPNPDRYLLLRGAPRDTFRIEHLARQARVERPVWRPHLFFADWKAPQLDALPKGDGPLVALAPGASWETKRWHVARWEELSARLNDAGARVVVLGQSGAEIQLEGGHSFVGQTDVREAACLLHAADLAVVSDSGLMHLALAAATPVVALFGPTDPDILIRDEPNFHPIRSTAVCSGHWNRSEEEPEPGVCPLGHDSCLDSIAVDDVFCTVERAIALPGRRA